MRGAGAQTKSRNAPVSRSRGLGFPALATMPSTRKITLWMGVGFHVGTGVFLPLGPFPLYMLCLYLPLIPWEEYADRWRRRAA